MLMTDTLLINQTEVFQRSVHTRVLLPGSHSTLYLRALQQGRNDCAFPLICIWTSLITCSNNFKIELSRFSAILKPWQKWSKSS